MAEVAKKGYREVQFLLGSDEGNIEQAKLWLVEVASQGNMDAQLYLGHILYEEGEIKQAKFWLVEAANQGNMDAQLYLAQIFFKEGDIKQAKFWSVEVANQGNAEAQFILGYILYYEEGDDIEQAKNLVDTICQSRKYENSN